MQKIIFFDLDGTLTPRSTWYELNLKLGITPGEDKTLFDQYLAETLQYNDWTKKLFRIHKSRGSITKDEIVDFAQTIELRPDAVPTIDALKQKGYIVVLLSGAVDTVVEAMAKRLGIVEWFACSKLSFDDAGVLSDIVSTGDEADSKLGLARTYLSKNNIAIDDAIAIGDGGNEEALFKVMKGILFGHTEKLKPLAWKQVENLSEIPNLV